MFLSSLNNFLPKTAEAHFAVGFFGRVHFGEEKESCGTFRTLPYYFPFLFA
jgi:hypothetical protein